MGISNSNIILDQFVLPHNLYRIENYFEDNCKVIVVDRDPRDVFLLNKYYWRKANATVPYSFDAEKFCSNYSKMRQAEMCIRDRGILHPGRYLGVYLAVHKAVCLHCTELDVYKRQGQQRPRRSRRIAIRTLK